MEQLIEKHLEVIEAETTCTDLSCSQNGHSSISAKKCADITKLEAIKYANWYFGQYILRNSEINGLTDAQIFDYYIDKNKTK